MRSKADMPAYEGETLSSRRRDLRGCRKRPRPADLEGLPLVIPGRRWSIVHSNPASEALIKNGVAGMGAGKIPFSGGWLSLAAARRKEATQSIRSGIEEV